MSREAAIAVMIGAAVVILALVAWAWRRRAQRDAPFTAPVGDVPAAAEAVAVFHGFYVATTRHGEPLERLAIKGLAFRSRADVTVTDAGVALDLTGLPRVFLSRERITDAAQATVAIDRVVERDGLARLSWRLDDGTLVDSYLRPQDASARSLTDAVRGILPTTSMGSTT